MVIAMVKNDCYGEKYERLVEPDGRWDESPRKRKSAKFLGPKRSVEAFNKSLLSVQEKHLDYNLTEAFECAQVEYIQ